MRFKLSKKKKKKYNNKILNWDLLQVKIRMLWKFCDICCILGLSHKINVILQINSGISSLLLTFFLYFISPFIFIYVLFLVEHELRFDFSSILLFFIFYLFFWVVFLVIVLRPRLHYDFVRHEAILEHQ